MDWIHSVPPHVKEDVICIFNYSYLTDDQKVDLLKPMVDSKLLITIIQSMTSTKNQTEPKAEDFLQLIPNAEKRNMMKIMIRGNNLDMLEDQIRNEDPIVQQAFHTWKRQKEEVKSKYGKSTGSEVYNTPHDAAFYPNLNFNFQDYSTPRYPQLPIGFESVPPPLPLSPIPTPPSHSPHIRIQTHFPTNDSSQQASLNIETTNNERDHSNGGSNVKPTFFNKLPECTTILILGETGVGKSTFINGLANYLKYGSMDAALKGGVEVLIRSFFTICDEKSNELRIDCKPTITAEFEGESDDNEHVGHQQSGTQSPRSYLFQWRSNGLSKTIRIVDTPGIGDSRGIEYDKLNVAKILSFISQFSELKAILVLLKPNDAKLTTTFRFCLGELLSHLHKSAADNLLFCCTNARSTHFTKGETIPTLKVFLKQLKDQRQIDISTKSERIYLFDNESFRYLCALRKGACFSEQNIRDYKNSWLKTVEETFRMFETISTFPAHRTQETVSLNNIRSIVFALARPLAEIARNQLTNVHLIEEKIDELQNLKHNDRNLWSRLYTDQVVLGAEELPYPVTVCTSKGCVEYRRLSPGGPMETVFKTECHPHCFLKGVQVKLCPNPQIQECYAFRDDINKCSECDCPWTTHMHVRYRLVSRMARIIDPTVEDAIKSNMDNIELTQLFIQNQTEKKEKLQEEADKISKSVAELACFLKKDSIMPYCDAFLEYIDLLIKEEKAKVYQGGSEDLLHRMEEYKDQYAKMIELVDSQKSTTNKTTEEINAIIEELKKLKTCGTLIADAQRFEKNSLLQHQAKSATAIDLSSHWIGRLTCQFQSGSMPMRYESRTSYSELHVKSPSFFKKLLSRY